MTNVNIPLNIIEDLVDNCFDRVMEFEEVIPATEHSSQRVFKYKVHYYVDNFNNEVVFKFDCFMTREPPSVFKKWIDTLPKLDLNSLKEYFKKVWKLYDQIDDIKYGCIQNEKIHP